MNAIGRMEARGFAVGAFVLAAVSTYGICGIAGSSEFAPHGVSLPFDRELWSRADWADSCSGERHLQSLREVQVTDLRARYLHPGMTREALRELLGKPDLIEEAQGGAGREWCYIICTDDIRNPVVTLRIAFDAQECVASSRVQDDLFKYK